MKPPLTFYAGDCIILKDIIFIGRRARLYDRNYII